ncbi:MAG TPA: AraC family transcriptional regulator [Rhizomicrobium sp.]|jgi:AraC-like DNA-binding protein
MDVLPCGCPKAGSGSRRAGTFGVQYSRYLPRCTAGRHMHPEARIILPVRGFLETGCGRRTVRVDSGTAFYRPAGDDHLDRYPAPMDCVTLVLGDGLPATSEPFALSDSHLQRAGALLLREMQAMDSASALVSEGLAYLCASIVLHRKPIAERGMPKWIGEVRDRIAASAVSPPTLAELARAVDRDPAYVAATFKRVYGSSIGLYLRHLRLCEARDLLETGETLADIAQRCGFSDQSHFTRHFRRHFRVAPAAYRRRLQATGVSQTL